MVDQVALSWEDAYMRVKNAAGTTKFGAAVFELHEQITPKLNQLYLMGGVPKLIYTSSSDGSVPTLETVPSVKSVQSQTHDSLRLSEEVRKSINSRAFVAIIMRGWCYYPEYNDYIR